MSYIPHTNTRDGNSLNGGGLWRFYSVHDQLDSLIVSLAVHFNRRILHAKDLETAYTYMHLQDVRNDRAK